MVRHLENYFDCSVDNISLHLKNSFIEELDKNSAIEEYSITAVEKPAKIIMLN